MVNPKVTTYDFKINLYKPIVDIKWNNKKYMINQKQGIRLKIYGINRRLLAKYFNKMHQ